MLKNKKGGEKLFSLWWFLILGVTAVSVGYGVILFFSQDIDIREFETGIIYSQVGNCLVKNNVLSDEVFKEDFDVYSYCHLSKPVFLKDFYLNISIKDKNDKLVKEIIAGNYQFQKQCEIVFDSSNTEKVKAEKYARCYLSQESISYFKEYRTEGRMSFLSASNNLGSRISTA